MPKTTVKLPINNTEITLVYNERGTLDLVVDDNNKPMRIGFLLEGSGYTIKDDGFMLPMRVCDARYVLVTELNVHVPYTLFVIDTPEN
jgi:hypothetical protein